ncbi:MAG: H-type lectin domain-containing protein [Magnetococcales bacterium]|nr:H-type lectin domain-containing protein [Magnetococcales bacterium]
MARWFWMSLTLVVVLVGVLVFKGGLPVGGAGSDPGAGEGDGQPARHWQSWLLGGEWSRLRDAVATLESERSQVSRLGERVVALETGLREQQSRLTALQALMPTPGERLESGSVLARQEDKEWRLASLFTRAREFRQRVAFSKPFAQPPRVMMGLVGIDFNQEKIQFLVSAEEVEAGGFTALLVTRAEERPREIRVSWLAFGPPVDLSGLDGGQAAAKER